MERCGVMAGDRLQPTQASEAACLLAGIAEAREDRQGFRVGATGVLRLAELAVDHAERGRRDGPPAGPGRAQLQGILQALPGHGGLSRVQREEPQTMQGLGLNAAVVRLPGEPERLAEPLPSS